MRRILGLAAVTLAIVASHASADADGVHRRIISQPYDASGLLFASGNAPIAGHEMHDAAALAVRGRELYDTHCVSCHGADLHGSAGVPSIANDGGAAVDFYLTTGRMPSAVNEIQAVHQPAHFSAGQIREIDAYVAAHATSVAIPVVMLDGRLLARGRALFEANCQACHGAAAQGATVGGGWIALPLNEATPVQIGEAIRAGPGRMPRFGPAQLGARDIDALATYVRYLAVDAPSYGGLTMDYLGPAAEGFVGAVFGVGALFWVIFFTGTKADGTRLSE